MLQNHSCNIILNIDHKKDGINDVPLYKIYGSYYHSDILNKRVGNNIDIHPNVLYVINCYNIANILELKTAHDFVCSELSNPIQEMLMIRYARKITIDIMEEFYNSVFDYVKSQNSNTDRVDLLYSFISQKYNVVVLTSNVNLGIARNRDRDINYILNNRKEFLSNNLTHVLLLDDSDFIGFTKYQKIDINYLYRQQTTTNIVSNKMKRSSSAAGYSYWQHLIPIDKIELYCPLIADLAEDAVTEAYLNNKSKKYSYKNDLSISQDYSTKLQKYEDNFVDYKSYSYNPYILSTFNTSLYVTTAKETKMSKHYNPPALYISNGKLSVCTTSGKVISLNKRMERLLFTKYVFILPLGNDKYYIIAKGKKYKNKGEKYNGEFNGEFYGTVQNKLKKLSIESGNIEYKYVISQATSGLASYEDAINIEKLLIKYGDNALYVSESLLYDKDVENLKVYKIIDLDKDHYAKEKQYTIYNYYYCYYINGEKKEGFF